MEVKIVNVKVGKIAVRILKNTVFENPHSMF